MALPEYITHSFIVRIWQERLQEDALPEELVEEAQGVTWRGHITHVPSHQRRYFENLNDIIAFVLSYLEERGGLST